MGNGRVDTGIIEYHERGLFRQESAPLSCAAGRRQFYEGRIIFAKTGSFVLK